MQRQLLPIVLFVVAACGVPGPGSGGSDTGDAGTLFNGRDAIDDVIPLDTDEDVDEDADEDVDDDVRDRDGTDDVSRVICGNGILEEGEACDDNNNFPNDGCSANCLSTEVCGNNVVDPGESCDDGNFDAGDGCDPICRREEGCGNGIVDIGEQCDDGNIDRGDGCSPECQREISLLSDEDNDNISDFDEGNGRVDTDGDGTPDSRDVDSDNDGILDFNEAGDEDLVTEAVDTDDDGVPDFRDTDSDGDEIPDAVEGAFDNDFDGIPNSQDTDSDGDFVGDYTETATDSDSDGIQDFLDLDSDNDGILDAHELFSDSDGDRFPNRVDLDSDNDGIPDREEAGDESLSSYPIDTDNDGLPDYVDLDSDNDGLRDATETGCPTSSDRRNDDSDNDTYPDLAEVLVGSDPCTFTNAATFRTYTDFFFILPEDHPGEEAPLEFSSDIARADVHFNIDSSGSMDDEIDNLRNGMRSFMVPALSAEIEDIGFGFSDYRDCRGYAFRLRQRITTSVSTVQAAMATLTNTSGGEEPGYSALRFIGDGAARGGCLDIAAFNPSANRVPGVADGTIGGVGFRDDAFPVVVHVTDESAEDSDCGSCASNQSGAINSLNAIDARMIGIVSSSSPRSQLQSVARATGAMVPVCAWDGARPSGCGSSQCCTGSGGAGVGSEDGMCPLVFTVPGNGSNLSESIVTGIVALVNTTAFEVTTRLRRDEDVFIRTGVDTTCFIRSIVPARFESSGTCSTTPEVVDVAPVDGIMDAFANVTPGTALFFDVTAHNDVCVRATDEPQAFFAYIDVVGDGITTLDTQSVTIIVPAAAQPGATVP